MRFLSCIAVLVALASACGGEGEREGAELREFGVYLTLDVTPEQREEVRARLEAHEDSVAVEFVDKDEAFAEFQKLFKGDEESLDSVTAEDLPESFRVTVKEGGDMESIASDVEGLPGVDEIVFPKETLPQR